MRVPTTWTWLASGLTLKQAWAQDVSALIFQAKGMGGSVIDATGCRITYALSCTDLNVCTSSSGITKTVTQNGASSFTMHYSSYGSLTSLTYSALGQSAAETCRLYGTTNAACTATVAINIGSISTDSTSAYVITQEAFLSYGQIPITAGPARAQASVSSCSRYGNTVEASTSSMPFSSSAVGSTSTSLSSVSSEPTSTSGASGLSTGAKAGIGAGVGVAAVGAIILGGTLLYLRRKKAQKATQALPAYEEKRETGGPVPRMDPDGTRYELYQPQVKHEMASGREAQELSASYDGYAKSPTGPRYELY